MNINIGAMDSRINILKKGISTINDMGEYCDDTRKIASIWAEVTMSRASEKLKATGVISREKTIKVVTRYRYDIDSTCKIQFEGNVYEIYSIATLGRREYMEIMCILDEVG